MTFSCEKKSPGASCNLVDVIKFICAMLVVAIHVPPLADISGTLNFALVNFAARVAVPFFFVSSSYFLFRKAYQSGTLDKKIVIAYIKRIFRLYVIWSALYMPFAYCNQKAVLPSLSLPRFFARYAFDSVFSAGYGHLWYLNAMIFAYLFLLILLSANVKPSKIACVSAVLYAAGVLSQSWFGLVQPVMRIYAVRSAVYAYKFFFATARNGLFEGLLFVLTGMFFAKSDFRIKLKTAVLCLVSSAALFAAEVFFLAKLGWIREYDMYFFLVPTVFFLFCIAVNTELPGSPVYKKLRTLSSLIYFSHMMVYHFVKLSPVSGAGEKYIAVLLGSGVLSYIIMRLSERCGLLRYLYK